MKIDKSLREVLIVYKNIMDPRRDHLKGVYFLKREEKPRKKSEALGKYHENHISLVCSLKT